MNLLKRIITPIVLLVVAACFPPARSGSPGGVLRVGVLPDQSEHELRGRYEPLIAYLSATADLKLELVIPGDYDELLDAFDDDRVQLAWFGGLTFIWAERRSQATPLVMRDIDLEFTSDFLVPKSALERSIEDFAGRRFSFGPRLSTSGHLMPRFFLHKRGIDPATFFGEVSHSAGHDETAGRVRDGEVDLGAANSVVVDSMFRDGRLTPGEVRVLERTPPYKNYVWAVVPHLDRDVRTRLLDAFLGLDRTVSDQAAILDGLGAGGFLPASRGDYSELRAAADILGLAEDTWR